MCNLCNNAFNSTYIYRHVKSAHAAEYNALFPAANDPSGEDSGSGESSSEDESSGSDPMQTEEHGGGLYDGSHAGAAAVAGAVAFRSRSQVVGVLCLACVGRFALT